ncbi:OsmC family protein [Rubrimonas sp.]|uniref:OsmC family protein n=1 Tax=Rubrimonas sp. TaxID=2036015 RepID=UPI002FDE00E0
MTTVAEDMTCAASLDIEAMQKTKAHLVDHPEQAKGSFSAKTVWTGGAQAVTSARSFTIRTDEPAPLGGMDAHIDPMELLLAALGSCLAIGWATHAKLRGVEFTGLEITVNAPFDLRGYLAIDPSVRPGFGELSYTVKVESDANPAVLEEIRQAAEIGSPMFDNIKNMTPVSGTLAA